MDNIKKRMWADGGHIFWYTKVHEWKPQLPATLKKNENTRSSIGKAQKKEITAKQFSFLKILNVAPNECDKEDRIKCQAVVEL